MGLHGGGHFLERFSEDGPLERLEKWQNVGNNIPAILPVPEHPSKSEIFSWPPHSRIIMSLYLQPSAAWHWVFSSRAKVWTAVLKFSAISSSLMSPNTSSSCVCRPCPRSSSRRFPRPSWRRLLLLLPGRVRLGKTGSSGKAHRPNGMEVLEAVLLRVTTLLKTALRRRWLPVV